MKDAVALKPAFLAALEEQGSVRAACEAIGTSPPTLYRWRADDPEFADAWAEALDACSERKATEADDQIRKLAFGECVDADGKRIPPNVQAAIQYARSWNDRYRNSDRVGVSIDGSIKHEVSPENLAAAVTQAALALKSFASKGVEERRAKLLAEPPEVIQVPKLVGGSVEMVEVPKVPEPEPPLTPEEEFEIERDRWNEEHKNDPT